MAWDPVPMTWWRDTLACSLEQMKSHDWERLFWIWMMKGHPLASVTLCCLNPSYSGHPHVMFPAGKRPIHRCVTFFSGPFFKPFSFSYPLSISWGGGTSGSDALWFASARHTHPSYSPAEQVCHSGAYLQALEVEEEEEREVQADLCR